MSGLQTAKDKMDVTHQGSNFVAHVPCENCGSSDANSLYNDGHTYCFACSSYVPSGEEAPKAAPGKNKGEAKTFTPITGDYMDLRKRHISEETCRKFGYFIASHDELGKIQVANYYDGNRNIIAQHVRTASKDFRWWGEKHPGLFGQHAWPSGQKRIIITEGELDAMSLSQAQGNSWPVVSIPNGCNGAKKALLRSLDWLETFDEVVLCFDNDEPGRAVIPECAELFTPGKCKVATLPLKDASDMWVAGRTKELLNAVRYQAKVYRPDGIICGSDDKVKEYVINFTPHADAEYPWSEFSRRVHGMRLGELVTHTAGTGIGKSTICREIAYQLGVALDQKVGIVSLEESVGRYGLLLTSIAANQRLSISDGGVTREDRERYYRESVGNGNFYLYDHWGSMAADNLMARIRYMIKGCGCRWIILDHLSIVVSGMDDGDNERKTLDKLMTDLRSLVEETGAGLHVISHLSRRHDGKSHEEGAQISLRDLRGSHSIVQLSDIVLGYERNQQDEEKSNQILIRRLKDRYTGETGKSGVLRYNADTGRVEEVEGGVEVFTVEHSDNTENQQDF